MALVRRSEAANGENHLEVLDEAGVAVPIVGDFLGHLAARGCSPNTVLAYGYDLGHLLRFLGAARGSFYVPAPGRLACNFEQIVW
jgi:integrase/recombinase XerD